MEAVRRNSCACVVLGLLVSGCWNTAEQYETARLQQMADTRATTRECVEAILVKPDYTELKTKLYISFDNPQVPSPYLTDTSFPTKKQIADLYKVYEELRGCRKIMLDWSSKMHPYIFANMLELFSNNDRDWAEAVSGKLSWGQFNRARQTVVAQNRSRLTEDARTAINSRDQHQFEIEQRQRAAAAMQQWAYQQQLLNKMNPQLPLITCNYIGNTATCM
jgi:hypothetical protein